MTTVKDRVDSIADTRNLVVDMMPTSAKIELAGKCTLDCVFCYQHEMKANHERQAIMTDEMFARVLQFIKNTPSVREVGLFYMGESGLCTTLAKKYHQLKQHGYFTYLTTNGTIRDVISDAIPYVDSLKVSWNYRNVNDFIIKTRRTPDVYNKIIDNIAVFHDACAKFGKKLTISTVLDSSKHEYEAALRKLSYDDHYWLPLQTQCGVSTGVGGVVGQYDNQSDQLPCWSLFKGLYIDVNGNVRTCCYGHHDCHVLYNIADAEQFTITSTLRDMRVKHLAHCIPDQCKGCITAV